MYVNVKCYSFVFKANNYNFTHERSITHLEVLEPALKKTHN